MTDSAADARKYAFRLLGYRSRSENELRERLEKKGFSGSDISSALMYLKETGYLDDHALALNLKRQAFNNKLLGHKRTKSFLLSRGVPNEIVEAALQYDEEAETEKIQKLIDKKLKTMGNYLDKKNEKRLWDFLVRKGYTFSTIRKACQNLKRIAEEEEN
ncbi:MAG: RecX family transcriptional regulator [Nitrospirota bacterium]|nr:RecX family transcriptional regulator [Nitrospirota bacterium]